MQRRSGYVRRAVATVLLLAAAAAMTATPAHAEDDPPADDRAAVEEPVDEPAGQEPPAEEPPAEEPPAEEPPAEEPPAEEPPVEEPPVEEPPVEEPPVEEPPVEEPPVEEPPAEDSCATTIALWADVPVSQMSSLDAEAAVVCLINAERAAAGVAPLSVNWSLETASRSHANEAVRLQWWFGGADEHTNPESGSIPADRAFAEGYCPNPAFVYVAENAYWHPASPTPRDAVGWWMWSDLHRDTLLNGLYTETGVGVVLGAAAPGDHPDPATFVQVFGVCS